MNFIKYWEFDAVNLVLTKTIEVHNLSPNSYTIDFRFGTENDYIQWNFSDKEERDFVYKIIINNVSAFPIQEFIGKD